jgi:4-amino-4-deoxy-L-arabinose transferase-like glycosyltransferase
MSSLRWALLLAAALSMAVLTTLDDYGLTYDEPYYLQASKSYTRWLLSPSWSTIDTRFDSRLSEHPPLANFLAGATIHVLHDRAGLVSELTAARTSVIGFVFALNVALFLFSSALFGRWVGTFVTVSFALLPRVFFHSHLATLDYPMTAMWFLALYAYWKGMRSSRWIYLSATLVGLAWLTKINGFFLYAPIGFLWILHFDRTDLHGSWTRLWPMLVIPPVELVVAWPWLWPNPIARLVEYFQVFSDLTIPTYYFGIKYGTPPWHLPFALAFLTLPVLVWLPAAGGSIARWKDRRDKYFVAFNALFPLVMIAFSPSKHDGVRLFLPAFPFFCVLAGAGIHYVAAALRDRKHRIAFAAAAWIALGATIASPVIRYHPYQSSYFGEVIGGVDGARKHGFEVHYWCSAYKELVPWLNENPQNVYHVPTCSHLLDFYRSEGLLDNEVRFDDASQADHVVLVARYGVFRDEAWKYYRREPVFSVNASDTVILGVYELDQPTAPFCEAGI